MPTQLKLLPKQKIFMESQAPELLYSGAFGAGKSRIGCEKGLFLCLKYPGNVGAIIRKNFAHLRYSTMETFFRWVCPDQFIQRFDKNTSTLYLKNGSRIYFMGIDQPSKVGSLEVGWIFVDEAVEVTEEDWIMLGGRLRLPGIPFYQLFGATNPGPPSHFLYKRFFLDKIGPVLQSNSLENTFLPAVFLDRLRTFTGRYKERYVEGKWIGFEGLVYDNFDPARHIIDSFDIPSDWDWYRAIDFGYTNPFVCQWWVRPPRLSGEEATSETLAELPYGRYMLGGKRPWFMVKEIYKSQKTVDKHADDIKAATANRIRFTVADWDAGDRSILEQHGIPTVKAAKAISAGIQEVHERIAADEVYFFKGDPLEVDTVLRDASKPASTVEEFPVYKWPDGQRGLNPKEVPVDRDNHGMDSLKYLLFTFRDVVSDSRVAFGKKEPLVEKRAWNEMMEPRNWRGM